MENLNRGDGRRETTRKYNKNKICKWVGGPMDGHWCVEANGNKDGKGFAHPIFHTQKSHAWSMRLEIQNNVTWNSMAETRSEGIFSCFRKHELFQRLEWKKSPTTTKERTARKPNANRRQWNKWLKTKGIHKRLNSPRFWESRGISHYPERKPKKNEDVL